jgi:hypothetical protein
MASVVKNARALHVQSSDTENVVSLCFPHLSILMPHGGYSIFSY